MIIKTKKLNYGGLLSATGLFCCLKFQIETVLFANFLHSSMNFLLTVLLGCD